MMLDVQVYTGCINFKDCKFEGFDKKNGNVQMKFVRDDKLASIVMRLEMSKDDFVDFVKTLNRQIKKYKQSIQEGEVSNG